MLAGAVVDGVGGWHQATVLGKGQYQLKCCCDSGAQSRFHTFPCGEGDALSPLFVCDSWGRARISGGEEQEARCDPIPGGNPYMLGLLTVARFSQSAQTLHWRA